MRDIHPFLVLSPRIFNEKTSLVIGLPMTTAEYNVDNPFAVAVGQAKGRKAQQISYILCHQPKSFDWRLRNSKPHPLRVLSDGLFAQVCACLNQIIRLGSVWQDNNMESRGGIATTRRSRGGKQSVVLRK